ncbi:xanthine/uracil permease [Anaeramoeba flamelloides]|uniref:Xanthine/uracil permease n=1 Tax=Anaeramoeba flamelloides TaxID=1746091 RepID=A0ABQ8Y453_9EUKA|nr:xanthine/uracil permease [Anaeramoeba flamelloides]
MIENTSEKNTPLLEESTDEEIVFFEKQKETTKTRKRTKTKTKKNKKSAKNNQKVNPHQKFLHKCTAAIDKLFKINEKGSTILCELVGGVLMFLCSIYTLRLQPIELNTIGIETGTIVTINSLISACATITMSVVNIPLVLSNSMSGTKFLSRLLVKKYKYSHSTSCGLMIFSSLLSLPFTFFLRKSFMGAIPAKFRIGIGFGIGMLIGKISFQYMLGSGDVGYSIDTQTSNWEIIISALISACSLLSIIYLLLRWRNRFTHSKRHHHEKDFKNEHDSSLSTSSSDPGIDTNSSNDSGISSDSGSDQNKNSNSNREKKEKSKMKKSKKTFFSFSKSNFLNSATGRVISYALPTFFTMIILIIIRFSKKNLKIRKYEFPTFSKAIFSKDISKLSSSAWYLIPYITANQFVDTVSTLLIIIQMSFLEKIEYDQKKFVQISTKGKISKFQIVIFGSIFWSIISGVFGSTMVIPLVESITGLVVGCRTGLSTLVCGSCFLIVFFCPPIIDIIQSVSTAPLLLLTCVLTMSMIKNLRYQNIQEVIPYVTTLLAIPLTNSITFGTIYGYSFWFLFVLFAPEKGYKNINKSMISIFVFSLITIILQYLSTND